MPGRCCWQHHRNGTPFDSRQEASSCKWTTWRAISARPYNTEVGKAELDAEEELAAQVGKAGVSRPAIDARFVP